MINKTSTISENISNEDNNTVDLDHALAVAGLGWYNIKYSLALALFLISAIVEPVGYSYVLPAAKCDLQMSDSQRGVIGSIPYIGVVATSFQWGYLTDTRGRKNMIIYSSLGAGIFGIAASFMPDLISFTIFKLLSSLCIACPASVPYSYIGEILPQKYRDITLSITNAMQIAGSAIVPLIAWGILPLDFRADFGTYYYRPWRLLAAIYSSLFIISALIIMFGPESPKYLVSQRKHEESLQVLRAIYAGNKGKSPSDYPEKDYSDCIAQIRYGDASHFLNPSKEFFCVSDVCSYIILAISRYTNISSVEDYKRSGQVKRLKLPEEEPDKSQSFLTSLKYQSLPLFKPPYVKWLCLNGILFFGIFSTLNGLYMWVPDVLNRVFSGGGEGLTACGIIARRNNETSVTENVVCSDSIDRITYVINTIASLSCSMIALAVSTTVKFFGKKVLLIAVYLVIGVFCILINFVTHNTIFAILLSSLPLTGLAVGPVNAYAVEIFPTNLRGMAISLSMMFGRSGSILGTNLAGLLINAACELTFYLFGGILIVCGLLSFLLPKSKPEPISRKVMTSL